MGDRAAKDALFDGFAEVAKAMANGRRAELIDVLAQGERHVDELADEIGQSVANTSFHLRALATTGLVATRRDGTRIYYRLASDHVVALWAALRDVAAAHHEELDDLAAAYLGDRSRLEQIGRAELVERISAGDVIVLDVRPAAEFAAGHIAGARSIPIEQLAELVKAIPRGVDVVAYCRGPYCVMADDAVRLLRRRGRRARRLEDGFPEWQRAERLVEPAARPFAMATDHDEASVFQVDNLLREARRQRNLGTTPVPAVCLLDPDGDTIRHLAPLGRTSRHADWACYHSELWTTAHDAIEIGIVPCAVGAPYAVLVAEELAASGCRLLVSVTSAGAINPLGTPPYFVLIERAWRDEGTSHRYLPPAQWASIPDDLDRALDGAFDGLGEPVHRGTSWTTDAPLRETATAIERARAAGVHTVEMEAAALYAYARARVRDVVCVAHVTNTMAVDGDDFEKGDDHGTRRILDLVVSIAAATHPHRT